LRPRAARMVRRQRASRLRPPWGPGARERLTLCPSHRVQVNPGEFSSLGDGISKIYKVPRATPCGCGARGCWQGRAVCTESKFCEAGGTDSRVCGQTSGIPGLFTGVTPTTCGFLLQGSLK